jgi:hypothetical protein
MTGDPEYDYHLNLALNGTPAEREASAGHLDDWYGSAWRGPDLTRAEAVRKAARGCPDCDGRLCGECARAHGYTAVHIGLDGHCALGHEAPAAVSP